ncbi:MAG: penicillin-binding protein 1C [Candidatus Aminicenantes bacterium]|nr:penicillin-binding protein 1C [Candidatus Aminicenantes bacterium]NIN86764.1 penicillin-binding protein 1C [Candidatus Aminicenantes bacterium]NIR07625.1 penicillin-binding protein 1C [Candidatus Aminicenantes bacterium]
MQKKQRFENTSLTWENGHAVQAAGVADPFLKKGFWTSKNVLLEKKFILIGLILFLLFISILFISVPLKEDRLEPEQAYRFYDRNGQLLTVLISNDGYFRMHVPFKDISPLFIKTLLMEEDRYFYKHFGINPFSIIRAVVNNIIKGRVVSGGSTITMQLARMMERRKRTLWAKLVEAVRALKLEMHYSKVEILAYYLALAPYGGNTEGLQAAAYKYFGKSAADLSIGEIALLIAIPKAPNQYRPDKEPVKAKAARDRILKKMLAAELITPDQYQRSLKEPITLAPGNNKYLALHTAWHLAARNPGQYIWHTTIDENMQRRVKGLLKRYIRTLEYYNITNASAVVIDNSTREVRVVVGSIDYFSKESLGANDGIRAPRSPGSTLKPFLYGLALQQGLISEKKILYDIPINYAGYSPQNYSKEFVGLVRMRDALTESLNVAAVRLSKQLGAEKLYNLLKDGGISTLNQPVDYYGLPLVLGGVEVKLIELTNLYASLANGGIFKPYKILQDPANGKTSESPGKRLLSEEAAWLVTHILTDVERPDFPESWQFSKNRPTIAWKTGTSYGHQDAWGIGYTPEYTIGVWVGNFSGASSQGLAGSKTAGPILFDLFQALQPTSTGQWFAKPDGVKTRKVCAVSGKLPSRHCTRLITEYYIETTTSASRIERCNIHQVIAVDRQTGKQADVSTSPGNIEKKVFEIWPPEIATHLLKQGVPVDNVPAYDIENMAGQTYYPPVILSPVKNTVYYQRLDKLDISDHGIKLSAAVTNRVRKIFWFLDDQLISETSVKEDVFINPGPGKYLVTLMDDVGGTAAVELVIKDHRELEKMEDKKRGR